MRTAEAAAPGRAAARDRAALAALVGVFVLGAALRVYQLGAESYWFDEIIMVHVTDQPTGDLLRQLFRSARAPLYPLLGHVWVQLFGTGEAATRSLSALCGALSIPLMYLVGEKLFSRKVGFIAALIMTLSAFHVYYSQEYRYYSLVMLLTLAAALFFIEALETGRLRPFLLFGLAGVALFYAHPLSAALFIGALGLFFLLLLVWKPAHRARLPAWLVSQALIVVGAAPTVLLRFVRASNGMADTSTLPDGSGLAPWWLEAPPVWEPVRTVVNFMILGIRYVRWLPALAAVLVFAVALFVVIRRRGGREWLAALRATPWRVRSQPEPWQRSAALVLFWFAGPIVLAYLSSFTVLPMYVERYLSPAAPAMYLLVAVVLVTLGDAVPEVLSVGLVAALLAFSLQQYYARDIKEQWDEMAAFVEANAGEDDLIAFGSDFGNLEETVTIRQSFDWYYPGEAPACDVDPTADDATLLAQIRACEGAGERVWLVLRWSDDPRMAAFGEYLEARQGGGLLGSSWFEGNIAVYRLGLPLEG